MFIRLSSPLPSHSTDCAFSTHVLCDFTENKLIIIKNCKKTLLLKHVILSQMKHQLDATLCRFYFCRVTLHVSGASAHHQEYLKLVRRPMVHVSSLQVSHHISLLGPELPALISTFYCYRRH